MKIISIILLSVFCFISLAQAEIYVIYKSDTKEIYCVSGKNDTVVPEGHEKSIVQGNMDTYEFIENPTNCFFKDGKFIVNVKKINDAYQARIEADEKAMEEALITQEQRKQAIAALKASGKELKHTDK